MVPQGLSGANIRLPYIRLGLAAAAKEFSGPMEFIDMLRFIVSKSQTPGKRARSWGNRKIVIFA